MKITEMKYGRTWNDGNFESTRIDLTAELEPTEESEDAFVKLYDQMVVLRDTQLDQVAPTKGRLRR